jgi:hypothetical protein
MAKNMPLAKGLFALKQARSHCRIDGISAMIAMCTGLANRPRFPKPSFSSLAQKHSNL